MQLRPEQKAEILQCGRKLKRVMDACFTERDALRARLLEALPAALRPPDAAEAQAACSSAALVVSDPHEGKRDKVRRS